MSSITKREFERACKILDRHMTGAVVSEHLDGSWWLSERSNRRDSDHGTGQPNAVLMEGSYGWTDITFADWGHDFRENLAEIGLFAEAYSGWAIHFYRI